MSSLLGYTDTHDIISEELQSCLERIAVRLGAGAGGVMSIDLYDIIDEIEKVVEWDYE